ncbi:MAG: sigma-E processing peptidase SpoIIGA [Sulfobacillus thermotolerans]|uniref:Sporulation sigma-E factor-processing peptidase n=1 Tax=Sulfobacillus thermotolerans TaxID=338644 RepID=A0ABM6RSQ7_9FIRM|nr:hypothetical protein BXT84_10955 [Sulfobacillus thermotolerans]MCY0908321.1 sigma-E processing peptidase SpoIIGA [Sulfobacillus thermotolerans]
MVSAVGTLVVSYAMDWSLLRLTIVLMDRKPRRWRLGLGAVVGTLPTLWVLLQQNLYAVPWELLILWPLGMLWLAVPRFPWRLWARAYLIFAGVTVLAGGIALVILTWLGQWLPGIPHWLLLGLSVPAVLWGMGHLIPRPRMRQYLGQAQKGEVSVTLNGSTLTLPCLWDSGNQMRDPVLRRPVIVMEISQAIEWLPPEVLAWVTACASGRQDPVPSKWQGRLGTVFYQSIGGTGILPVVALEEAKGQFQGRWYRLQPVALAFTPQSVSSDHSYRALVSPDCIITINQEGVGA